MSAPRFRFLPLGLDACRAMAAAAVLAGTSFGQEAGELFLEPFEVRSASGNTLEAHRGLLHVTENRHDENSKTIQIAFVRLVGTGEDPGPPLIYLHGGPGGQATSAVRNPGAVAKWERFTDAGDVILLDQRGCGRSRPSLVRPLATPPPPAVLRDRASLEHWLASAAVDAKQALEADGIDYRGYDTEQSADDVDDLRRALGYESMRLLGFSYGTHLGLSVLRRHGEHVDAAILVGVEGPGQTYKLPSAYDAHIRRLSRRIAADPVVGADVPDFEALVRRVLDKLRAEPIRVEVRQPITNEPVLVPIGPEALSQILVRDVGDTSDLPVFPRLLWSLDRGDVSVLRWFVQKRYGAMRGFPTFWFTVDAASGAPVGRRERILAEAENAVLGNAMNIMFPKAAAVWEMPILGDAFRAPLVTDVRTLFISGELDANTPPYQAEQAAWGFTDATHLVQRHAGHEDWMRNDGVLEAMLDFVAGSDVRGRNVDMPKLRFIPVEGAVGDGPSHPSVRG